MSQQIQSTPVRASAPIEAPAASRIAPGTPSSVASYSSNNLTSLSENAVIYIPGLQNVGLLVNGPTQRSAWLLANDSRDWVIETRQASGPTLKFEDYVSSEHLNLHAPASRYCFDQWCVH